MSMNDYFMLPTYIENIGEVYPIKIKEYEVFKKMANKYLLAGRKWVTNIFKYPKDEYLLDYFVKNAHIIKNMKQGMELIELMNGMEENPEIQELKNQLSFLTQNEMLNYSTEEMSKMFSMCLNKKVEFEFISYDEKEDVIDYLFKVEGEENYSITKYNYEELRNLIMKQNLLFEPISSPSAQGNEIIQKAIESLNKKSVGMELESVCSVVSVYKGISDTELYEYTYYRLMLDYETIERLNNNIFNALFMAQGSTEAKIQQLCEKIDLQRNPYDGLLRKHKASSLDKRLASG